MRKEINATQIGKNVTSWKNRGKIFRITEEEEA